MPFLSGRSSVHTPNESMEHAWLSRDQPLKSPMRATDLGEKGEEQEWGRRTGSWE